MPTTIERTKRKRSKRSQTRSRRTRSARLRSADAQQALEWFVLLNGFFASDTALARALGWDVQTVGEWRAGDVVRPQRRKRDEVRRLLSLCDEANVYLREPRHAGDWALAPSPQLGGDSPAELLQQGGDAALQMLNEYAFRTMPRPDSWIDDDDWEDIPLPVRSQKAKPVSGAAAR
jgi:hypothetical protein